MKSLLSLALLLALFASTFAQIQPISEKGKRSDLILVKLHQVELLAQIVPLAMTKEQLNRILPMLEKIRADQKKVMAMEDDEMAKVEAKADAAIKAAIEKGETPPLETLGLIHGLAKTLATHRSIVLTDNANDLYEELKKSLNAGQLTVMAKTIDAKVINATKPEDVKDEQRILAFIKVYLLDPAAYDLMVKMSLRN